MQSRTSLVCVLLKQGYDPAAIVLRLALRRALLGSDRVLDIGCGCSMNMRWLGVPHPTGLEGYVPALEEARRKNTHDELVQGDVRSLDQHFQAGQFDTCVALDVIEHLTKEDGWKMLTSMERIATRKVIILTPSGFLPQRHLEQGDLQEHLSGWEAEEMRAHGYEVTGLLGPKTLRGDHHHLKGRPKLFWGMVSLLGHFLYTRKRPAKAAAILCVKTKLQPACG
jgi:hypothetical protein